MALSIGIVGLPNVGKSTFFNSLTDKCVPAENFPFCTIEPSHGIVRVPDERLKVLADISKSEKIIETTIEIVDIAGLVKGASEGEGLGNEFLTNIRNVDAIAHMVRVFNDDDIIHTLGSVEPKRDIEIINTELILADISTITKHIEKIQKDIRKGDKEAIHASKVLGEALKMLESGKLLIETSPDKDDLLEYKKLGLITSKKVIYVFNTKDGNVPEELLNMTKNFVILDVSNVERLNEMEDGEVEEFKQSGVYDVDEFIQEAHRTLGLITFLTTGEKETRAWNTEKDSTAPQAAGKIHTDFEKKFIKAEVVSYEDLQNAGSVFSVREKGLYRLEGKDYVVKDGDVCLFRCGQ